MEGIFVPWSNRSDSPGYIIDGSGCHIWIGSRNSFGYAQGWDSKSRRVREIYAIRYEREIGPIPAGSELDHYACNNGPNGCCNPHHCRPVSHRENTLRGKGVAALNAAKTHCPRGHELVGPMGQRKCRICERARDRHRKSRMGRASEVLPAATSDLSPEARQAVLDGLRLDRYRPHPDCPCERCHRLYRTIP